MAVKQHIVGCHGDVHGHYPSVPDHLWQQEEWSETDDYDWRPCKDWDSKTRDHGRDTRRRGRTDLSEYTLSELVAELHRRVC